MQIAQHGDRVRVEIAWQPKSHAASESPAGQKVMEFIVGSRDVMRGLSLGVVGMTQGEQKQLTLQPSDAYGQIQPRLVKEIPRHQFPKHLVLRVGKRLTAKAGSTGSRRHVRIVEINAQSVLVDGNHRLAGKVVVLVVRLISVDSSADANRTRRQFDLGGES